MKKAIGIFALFILLLLPSIALAEEAKETTGKIGTVGNTIVSTTIDSRGRILQQQLATVATETYSIFQPQVNGQAYHDNVAGIWLVFRSESSYNATVSFNNEMKAYLHKLQWEQMHYDKDLWLKRTVASLEYWASVTPKCDYLYTRCSAPNTQVGP